MSLHNLAVFANDLESSESSADSVTKHARKAGSHVLIVYPSVVPPVLYLMLLFLIGISEYLSPFREIYVHSK